VNNFLDQLNLTPAERRVVVAIGLVVIVVLNLLFVWPHFGEWTKIRTDLDRMHANMVDYNRKILQDTDPKNGLQKQLAKLVHAEGTGVMNNQIQLQNTIGLQARKTGVDVSAYNPGGSHPQTNEFFEEESIKITIDSQEPQLVNFLYNIGGDPAMIRVSELELAPQDQNRYRLRGAITLTANYTKRAPAPGAAAAKKPGIKQYTAPGPLPAKLAPGQKLPGSLPRPGQLPAQRGLPGQHGLPGQRGLPSHAGPPGMRGPPGPNLVPRNPFSPVKRSNGP
jgi:hypothetical protein